MLIMPPHINTAQHAEIPIRDTAPSHGQYGGDSYVQYWQTNANEHFPHYVYQNNAHTSH